MILKISKSEEIIERLRKEGKVKTLEMSPEWWAKWNLEMEEIRRDSRYKQAMSEIEASKIILNA